MRKVYLFALILSLFPSAILSQRPVGDDDSPKTPIAVPTSVEVKYEGGMFGYKEKEPGELKIDDANNRLVFYGKDRKEKFSVSYDTMTMVYPNHESVTTTTGNVVSHLPLPGAGLFSLLKEKRRFLIIQFEDAEVDILGTVNFRVEDKEKLEQLIHALGAKAKLAQRGDAYYRPRPKTKP